MIRRMEALVRELVLGEEDSEREDDTEDSGETPDNLPRE